MSNRYDFSPLSRRWRKNIWAAFSATKMLRDFSCEHVTPCNFAYDFCRNKISEQVQEGQDLSEILSLLDRQNEINSALQFSTKIVN